VLPLVLEKEYCCRDCPKKEALGRSARCPSCQAFALLLLGKNHLLLESHSYRRRPQIKAVLTNKELAMLPLSLKTITIRIDDHIGDSH